MHETHKYIKLMVRMKLVEKFDLSCMDICRLDVLHERNYLFSKTVR